MSDTNKIKLVKVTLWIPEECVWAARGLATGRLTTSDYLRAAIVKGLGDSVSGRLLEWSLADKILPEEPKL
jgi:hypothetical protein